MFEMRKSNLQQGFVGSLIMMDAVRLMVLPSLLKASILYAYNVKGSALVSLKDVTIIFLYVN